MFEKRIAKSILRFFGVERPTEFDIARFCSKFKINKMTTSKKIITGMTLPVLFNVMEFKMFGSYEEPKE